MAKSNKSLKSRVESVLAASLDGFRSGLMMSKGNLRLLGYVVSSSFKGQDHSKRQARLKKLLEAELDVSELAKIGPIVTMTPAEANVGDTAA